MGSKDDCAIKVCWKHNIFHIRDKGGNLDRAVVSVCFPLNSLFQETSYQIIGILLKWFNIWSSCYLADNTKECYLKIKKNVFPSDWYEPWKEQQRVVGGSRVHIWSMRWGVGLPFPSALSWSSLNIKHEVVNLEKYMLQRSVGPSSFNHYHFLLPPFVLIATLRHPYLWFYGNALCVGGIQLSRDGHNHPDLLPTSSIYSSRNNSWYYLGKTVKLNSVYSRSTQSVKIVV